MFLRKYWLPLSVFLVAIAGVGLYLLATQPPKDPIIIYKPVEPLPKSEAKAPVGETSQGGHFHADGTWHEGPHDAHADETQLSPSAELPETALDGDFSSEAAYQALREKYPDRTNNPHPFENVPVDLWDFEATKKAFMDHFNFYVEQGGNKPEVFNNNREVRIAYAVMTNISNAAQSWTGIFTREQQDEINALRERYFDFQGVKVNHKRVDELVKKEGYSVSEALDISREEDRNR